MSGLARREVAIVGGGLVGSLLATYLARRQARVTVYEKLPDPRASGAGGGRSINLVVTSRGLEALDRVGLKEGALELTVPVLGRMMHSLEGELAFQPYGRDESECNYSISRAGLNRFLISEAEARGVTFHFERSLSTVDFDAGRLTFDATESFPESTVEAPLIVGTDGAASAVRRGMRRLSGFEESMVLLSHGYKELTIPAGPDGGYRIEGRALHIWPRGEVMLMALPNRDGSFTVTLYLPRSGPQGFDRVDTEGRALALFEEQFSDSIPLIPDLAANFLANPSGDLGTVRCYPWHVRDRALLLGDAAHAVVPFFGQGMNCGFEDCSVLDRLLDEPEGDGLDSLFRAFGESRKPNADAIADMALENFDEMRSSVGEPRFLLRKQVEHLLEERIPTRYRSRYSMVMYSSIPYAVAQAAGRIQEEILAELCLGLERAEELDMPQAERLIGEKLTPYLRKRGVTLDY